MACVEADGCCRLELPGLEAGETSSPGLRVIVDFGGLGEYAMSLSTSGAVTCGCNGAASGCWLEGCCCLSFSSSVTRSLRCADDIADAGCSAKSLEPGCDGSPPRSLAPACLAASSRSTMDVSRLRRFAMLESCARIFEVRCPLHGKWTNCPYWLLQM